MPSNCCSNLQFWNASEGLVPPEIPNFAGGKKEVHNSCSIFCLSGDDVSIYQTGYDHILWSVLGLWSLSPWHQLFPRKCYFLPCCLENRKIAQPKISSSIFKKMIQCSWHITTIYWCLRVVFFGSGVCLFVVLFFFLLCFSKL